MTTSLHCTAAIHAALVASPEFARLRLVGYQQMPASATEPADVIEFRRCGGCGSTLGRELGIGVRLAAARHAHGGNGDQSMIGRCKRALRSDPMTGAMDVRAVLEFVTAVADERLMGGGR